MNRLPLVSRLLPLTRRRLSPLTAMTVLLGLLTVAWPLAWAPAGTYALAVLGAVALLAAAFLRWDRGPALAVAAAIVSSAFSTAGTAVLAAEGLFILAYLLAADAPPAVPRPGPWLRRQEPLLLAGLIAAGAVLAMDAVRPAVSAWVTLAGLAAAVTAYLIALPKHPRAPAAHASQPDQPTEPDTQEPNTR